MSITTSLLEPLLSIDDLADYLCVPKKTIYGWRLRGEGPVAFRAGRRLRYRHADVQRWIADRTVLPHSEPDGLIAVADGTARGEGSLSAAPLPNPRPGSRASHLAEGDRHGSTP